MNALRASSVAECNVVGGEAKADRYYQFYSGSIATAKGLIWVIDDHISCAWADADPEEE